MPVTPCYIEGCPFNTPDVFDAMGAVIMNHHLSTAHATPPIGAAGATKVKREIELCSVPPKKRLKTDEEYIEKEPITKESKTCSKEKYIKIEPEIKELKTEGNKDCLIFGGNRDHTEKEPLRKGSNFIKNEKCQWSPCYQGNVISDDDEVIEIIESVLPKTEGKLNESLMEVIDKDDDEVIMVEINESVRPKIEGKAGKEHLNENYTGDKNREGDDDVIFLEEKDGGSILMSIETIPLEGNQGEPTEEKNIGTSGLVHLQPSVQRNVTNLITCSSKNEFEGNKISEMNLASGGIKPQKEKCSDKRLCGGEGQGSVEQYQGSAMKVEQSLPQQDSNYEKIANNNTKADCRHLNKNKKDSNLIKSSGSKKNCRTTLQRFLIRKKQTAIRNCIKKLKREEHNKINGLSNEGYRHSDQAKGEGDNVEGKGDYVQQKNERIEARVDSNPDKIAINFGDEGGDVKGNVLKNRANETPDMVKPQKVLIFTMLNASDPINVNEILKLCNIVLSDVGKVVKIQVNDLEFLVEFDCQEAADVVKDGLQGIKIHKGRQVLTGNVQYSRETELKVHKNNDFSWNFTKGVASKKQRSPRARFSTGHGHRRPSRVMMVYTTTPEKVNCRVFYNLFSQYGKVNRISFMRSKEGCALLEMEDPESVGKAIRILQNVKLFGHPLDLDMSKDIMGLSRRRKIFPLPDGTDSYKDYSRYRNKDLILLFNSPSKFLHFQNVPKIEERRLYRVFSEDGAPRPIRMMWFSAESDEILFRGGLLEFETREESCEAMALINHVEIEIAKVPYIMKLYFTKNTF